jgi:hypothetical protein
LADFEAGRNCPPFGVKTVLKSRTCELRFCPYCHVRKVVYPAFDAVDRLLRINQRRNRLLKVCVFRSAKSLHPRDFRDLSSLFEAFLWALEKYRRLEVDQLNPEGGFVWHSIDYTKAGNFRFTRTGVLVVDDNPKDAHYHVEPYSRGRSQSYSASRLFEAIEFAQVTRQRLARLIGTYCRYPPGMMLRGTPWLYATYCAVFRRRRLLATFGASRGVAPQNRFWSTEGIAQ